MSSRLALAVAVAKVAAAMARRVGGGGSTIPGLAALTADPNVLSRLAGQIPRGASIVTGTNGKTTTSGLIASILGDAGLAPLHNRTGSNLLRGLASTLALQADWRGRLRVGPNSIGLFEVDEATVPPVVQAIRPRVVVVTNLFRDQLDRYGEIDTIAARWRRAFRDLPTTTTLVLNADDPLVADLGTEAPGPVIFYGVDDTRNAAAALEHAADSKWCLRCQARLQYRTVFYGHVGHYTCPQCAWGRPQPNLTAVHVESLGIAGSEIEAALPDGSALKLVIGLPGLYNVYNALAAVAAGLALGLPYDSLAAGVAGFTAAFGRAERLEIDGRNVYVLLAKNPAGLNEVLHTLFRDGEEHRLLLVLNDEIADGRDVSWIWDADFEIAAGKAQFVVAGGIRAEDMALRAKYAQLLPDSMPIVERDLDRALQLAVDRTPPGETLYVVPTYTAMLELRRILTRRGLLAHYLERVS